MPSIELGSIAPPGATGLDTTPLRQAASLDATATVARPAAPATSAKPETRIATETSDPPVDLDRVAMVRKAVESGTYPIIPARIVDAMIAAGILLASGKS